MEAAPLGVSIEVRSPGLAEAAPECVVVLPTFRRPGPVLETLASLRAQQTRRSFAVIVVENDAEGREGLAAVAPLLAGGELAGLAIVAHERGNCCAYNAGFATALDQFPSCRRVLVIDDDEQAAPEWLERMCAASDEFGADIVGGPQVPRFAETGHRRWAAHPVFAPPYTDSGRVPALYSSGNLMIRREVLEAMPRPFLDPRFNFMGGGDSDFLSRAASRGFRLAWCHEAEIFETVPARRVEADWVRARSLRNGVISTLVERGFRTGQPLARTRVVAKSLALLVASPVRAALRLARSRWPAEAAYPVYVAVGRLLAEFGYVNEQYRQPEKN